MKSSGRQHVLLSGSRSNGAKFIAGPFSSADVGKRLDKDFELSARASTFADLERALLPGNWATTSFPGG